MVPILFDLDLGLTPDDTFICQPSSTQANSILKLLPVMYSFYSHLLLNNVTTVT
jgi:hypothetical protein